MALKVFILDILLYCCATALMHIYQQNKGEKTIKRNVITGTVQPHCQRV